MSVGNGSVQRRIEALRRYKEDLTRLLEGIDLVAYKSNSELKYAVERLCYLASEAILDSLEHILVKEFELSSLSYRDILESSYEKGIVPKDIYKDLEGLSGFRNILAHSYLDIDDEIVYSNAKKFIELIPKVVNMLEEWVQ